MFKKVQNVAPQVDYQELPELDRTLIDENEKTFLNYLQRLYKEINGEVLNLDGIQSAVEALKLFNERSQYNYLDYLLNPEMSKGCKLPSPMPVPSSAFQLHNSITLSTSTKGNLVFMMNPFFLYNQDSLNSMYFPVTGYNVTPQKLSSGFYTNTASMTGSNEVDSLSQIHLGQGIPGVYSSYRVVSASLVVKYIGRLDIASGVIGGAIIFDESLSSIGLEGTKTQSSGEAPVTSNIASRSFDMGKYANFDYAQDSFYHREMMSLKGVREIYFPIDNSFEEYYPVFDGKSLEEKAYDSSDHFDFQSSDNSYKKGFYFLVYVLGAPVESACFKFDYYINFECIPNPKFLNYMPITPSEPAINTTLKGEYVRYVQKEPVTESDKKVEEFKPRKSIWQSLKDKFGKYMPSMVTIAREGLSTAIPALRPALTLAGNLLQDRMQMD